MISRILLTLIFYFMGWAIAGTLYYVNVKFDSNPMTFDHCLIITTLALVCGHIAAEEDK